MKKEVNFPDIAENHRGTCVINCFIALYLSDLIAQILQHEKEFMLLYNNTEIRFMVIYNLNTHNAHGPGYSSTPEKRTILIVVLWKIGTSRNLLVAFPRYI